MFIFIGIELTCFPFYCGILIDFVSIPVFSSTLKHRLDFYDLHPWLFTSFHWIIGSVFMYQLASYIGLSRNIVRPGVMWFVRDPNDPNFNAIQEILKRSVFTQIKKLLFGVILYATLIIGCIGGACQVIIFSDYLCTILNFDSIFRIAPIKFEYQYIILI